MHKERIEKAIETLERVRPLVKADEKRFDMGTWFAGNRRLQELNSEHDCGTKACAVGYFCADPWHQAQGLAVDFYDGGADTPVYAGLTEADAAARYFGIPHRTAVDIFIENNGEGVEALDQVVADLKNLLTEGVPA